MSQEYRKNGGAGTVVGHPPSSDGSWGLGFAGQGAHRESGRRRRDRQPHRGHGPRSYAPGPLAGSTGSPPTRDLLPGPQTVPIRINGQTAAMNRPGYPGDSISREIVELRVDRSCIRRRFGSGLSGWCWSIGGSVVLSGRLSVRSLRNSAVSPRRCTSGCVRRNKIRACGLG